MVFFMVLAICWILTIWKIR